MRKIILFFVFLTLFSCDSKSVRKQLLNFIGTEIIIPDDLQLTILGRDTLLQYMDVPIKMIVWYDSAGCASCQVKQIQEWENIIAYTDSLKNVFEIIFVFSPKASDYDSVRLALLTSDFEYPVFIDDRNSFGKMNPRIPSDKRMHTFLIDGNNEVILVGNPVYNDKLWELYKENIKSQAN